MRPRLFYFLMFLSLFARPILAQDSISFEFISEFEYPSVGLFIPSNFSNVIDRKGRAYVYTANKHIGVITFYIADQSNPIPVDTLTVQDFQGLRPTHVSQHENLLYVALGEFEGVTQSAGLAIVNIEDPENGVMLSQWDSIAYNHGCPIALVEQGNAFLGAMEDGIIILDISDQNNIRFVSQLTLERNFPKPPTLTSEPHARGLALYNNKLLVAHDAGGLRVVDISDLSTPIEQDMYVNDAMYQLTQVAYNKVEVKDEWAFISTDYCGMEVVDLTQLGDLPQGDWYNPFDCMPSSWFGGEGHTNGIKILDDEELLFMSAGDTEILAYDISEPSDVSEIGRYQMLQDSTVAWSLDVQDDLIVLSCIDNHLLPLQPYYGDFGGIILLKWNRQVVPTENIKELNNVINLYPNPASTKVIISGITEKNQKNKIIFYNSMGVKIHSLTNTDLSEGTHVTCSAWTTGLYLCRIITEHGQTTKMFLKQ